MSKVTEIEQGNKLIAEFMGLVRYNEPGHPYEYGYYHQQWNYLMPVVQKIRDTPMIKGKVLAQTSYWENISEALTVVEIDTLFLSVVAFIKFYNTQKL